HKEKSGSLKVNSQKQIFKCFGCGAKGDVIDFVMKFKNIEYKAAFQFIADFYKIGDFKDLAKDFVPEPVKELPVSHIDKELLLKSTQMKLNLNNNFIMWLDAHFSDNQISDACDLYKIGSSKFWPGATIFWQLD